jgi:hypothetical protein
MATDATNKDVIKAIENLTGTMTKLIGGSTKNVSVGRTSNSTPSERTSSGARLYSQLEKEIKKPTTPLKKAIVKMLETTWGRAVGQMIVHVKTYTQEYYHRMTSIASGFARKIFGNLMDELDPFIEAVKATGSYLWNMLKTIPKFIGTIKNTFISAWDGFKKIGEKIGGFFKPKAEDKKDKELKKQTSIERKILLTQGKIIRWLTYIEKNTGRTASASGGASAYGAARTARWIRNMGRNMNRPDTEGGIPTPQPERRGLIRSVVGTIWGGLSGAAKWAGSVVMGVFKTISSVGGLIGGMVPFIGPLIGPLLAIGLPLLLGSTIFKGAWDWFKQTEPGKWVNENIISPFLGFMENTFLPVMEKAAIQIGGWLVNVISEALKPESQKAAERASAGSQKLSEKLGARHADLLLQAKQLKEEGKFEESKEVSEKAKKFFQEKQKADQQKIESDQAVEAQKMLSFKYFFTEAVPVAQREWTKFGDIWNAYVEDVGKWSGTSIPKRQKGGPVPIIAHEGEYVIRKEAVDKYGMGKMNLINSGKLPMFQKGGRITNFGTGDDSFGSVKDMIGGAESSGGRADWAKAGGTARGKYQFIAGTWNNLVTQMGHKDWLVPTYRHSGYDARTDTAKQEAVMDYMLKLNSDKLKRNDLNASKENLYLMHFLGDDRGIRILKEYRAGGNKMLGDYMSDKEKAWNSPYANMSVSKWLASAREGKFAGRGSGGTGIIGMDSSTSGTGDSFMDFVSSIWDMTKAIGSALWEEAFGPEELMKGPDTSQSKSVVTAETARSNIPSFVESINESMKEQGSPTVINQIDNSSVGGNGYGPVIPPPPESMLGVLSKAYLLQINTNASIYK